MFPFTNNYKVGKERISEVAPFRSETFVRETGQMVVLRMGYTFEFGRKHKAGNKGLNNSDTDSGIINMQRSPISSVKRKPNGEWRNYTLFCFMYD